jgi:hypothetical protein
MKTTMVLAFAVALVLGAAACDRNTEVSKTPSSPQAGAGASEPRESNTPSTPGNVGPPQSQAERRESSKPVQGQVDPKEGEQQRDFRTSGEGKGPSGR